MKKHIEFTEQSFDKVKEIDMYVILKMSVVVIHLLFQGKNS